MTVSVLLVIQFGFELTVSANLQKPIIFNAGLIIPIMFACFIVIGLMLLWLTMSFRLLSSNDSTMGSRSAICRTYAIYYQKPVLTGHVWDANNRPGPFVNLKTLKHGDQIKIYAFGHVYTYEVRENRQITADNVSLVFKHEDQFCVTLVPCEAYNSTPSTYSYRRTARAVLISVK